MKVRLETTDRDPFWLIGDPNADPREESDVLTETWQITRSQQATPGAGYDSQNFYDRNNQKVSFDASKTIEFTSDFERMDYLARLAPALRDDELHRWEGLIYLQLNKGDSLKEWPMPNAVISLSGVEVQGEVKLNLRYKIQAGGIAQSTFGLITNYYLAGQPEAIPAVLRIHNEVDSEIIPIYDSEYGAWVQVIITRNSPTDVCDKAWRVAGSYAPGFAAPISDHFGAMAAEWGIEFGGGLTSGTDEYGPYLELTSLFGGPLANVEFRILTHTDLIAGYQYRQGDNGPIVRLLSPDSLPLSGFTENI